MLKQSIFFVLALGVIFAQTISAYTVMYSDDEYDDGEEPDNIPIKSKLEENETDTEEEFAPINEYESSTLTCLLFGDLGCNAECSTAASAFSVQGTGQCSEQTVCVCTLQLDNSLDDLLKAKIENTDPKNQIPATRLGLINEMDELDYNKIKAYVGQKLKPLLDSSGDTLKGINYKNKLTDALKTNASADEALQNIIREVRRTENQSLATVLKEFLKSNPKIKETRGESEDDIAEVIGYFTVDQFAKRIDQLNKPAPKKSVRKPPTRNTSSKQNSTLQRNQTAAAKNPKVETPPVTSQKPAEEPNKQADSENSISRFQLTDFADKNFVKKSKGSINKTFSTDEYTVKYQKSRGGDIHFTWKKGNDEVEMHITEGGESIRQNWRLGNVNIQLQSGSISYKNQVWDFGNSKYTYNNSSGGGWAKGTPIGKRAELQKILQNHKDLIAEWCDNNLFLVGEKNKCVIY